MTAWLAAATVGIAVALLGYLPAARRRAAFGWLAAARALATTLVTAVALGAPVPNAQRDTPLVALDASASWTRATDASAIGAARDSAARIASTGGAPVVAVGESLRVAPGASVRVPRDRASRVAGAADSAAAAGRALVLVSDGEVDDPEALARAPAGSRVLVLRPARAADAAVVDVDAPTDVAPGDTATVTVTVAADSAGAMPGRVGVRLDGGAPIERPLSALGAFARATVTVRVPIGADVRAHTGVLAAFVAGRGDRDPRNDTASRAIGVTSAPRAVVVSTAPDYDVGQALSVLRGALAVPVRAYYRVAPGEWRVAGTLAPAREADVRAAAAGAGLLVLHGDTAALGSPRALGRGALALLPAVDAVDTTTDWYAGPSGASGPLAAISDLSWDSLPPLNLAPGGGDALAATRGLAQRWTGVVARAGRRGPPRAVVGGGTEASGRRVAIVSGAGFWRWSFRGGAGAVAAPALWGALFDWLADAPAAATPNVTPAELAVRSGAAIRWRGVRPADSIARVRLVRRDTRDTLSLTARRDPATGELRSDSPAPGVYDVAGGGLLVVNASAELLPRRASVRSGPVGVARATTGAPTTPITPGWPLAAATLLLCAEWGARRRLGLR